MPSFISSFRGIVVTAVAIVAAYCAFIEIVRPKILIYPDQNFANIARAEHARLSRASVDTVLIGSSLAARLPEDLWPAGFENLSLGGHAPLVGLDILTSSVRTPRLVVIEINWIVRATVFKGLNELDQSLLKPFRPWLRGLRVAYQPNNLLLTSAARLTSDRNPETACMALDKNAPKRSGGQAGPRIELAPPSFTETQTVRALTRVEKAIQSLQERGVSIAFVEFPVSAGMANSDYAVTLRQRITHRFPTIPLLQFDPSAYSTTDGLHLTPDSARRFGCALLNRLNALTDGE